VSVKEIDRDFIEKANSGVINTYAARVDFCQKWITASEFVVLPERRAVFNLPFVHHVIDFFNFYLLCTSCTISLMMMLMTMTYQ